MKTLFLVSRKILGVEYISYHACPNGFILYRGEYAEKEKCIKCGHDWCQELRDKAKAHGPPHKILRNMPIIPRIKRIFH